MAAEGLAIARGDVVHLTHGLIDGGVAGRVLGGSASRLTLAGAIGYEGAGDYLLLRLADGALHTSAVTHPEAPSAGGETEAVILETPLSFAPDAKGADPLDTLWRFYARTRAPGQGAYRRCGADGRGPHPL